MTLDAGFVLAVIALVIAVVALTRAQTFGYECRREREHERNNEAQRERYRVRIWRRQDHFNRGVSGAFWILERFSVDPPRVSDVPPDSKPDDGGDSSSGATVKVN